MRQRLAGPNEAGQRQPQNAEHEGNGGGHHVQRCGQNGGGEQHDRQCASARRELETARGQRQAAERAHGLMNGLGLALKQQHVANAKALLMEASLEPAALPRRRKQADAEAFGQIERGGRAARHDGSRCHHGFHGGRACHRLAAGQRRRA